MGACFAVRERDAGAVQSGEGVVVSAYTVLSADSRISVFMFVIFSFGSLLAIPFTIWFSLLLSAEKRPARLWVRLALISLIAFPIYFITSTEIKSERRNARYLSIFRTINEKIAKDDEIPTLRTALYAFGLERNNERDQSVEKLHDALQAPANTEKEEKVVIDALASIWYIHLALALLIIAEIKGARFRWRFALIYCVSVLTLLQTTLASNGVSYARELMLFVRLYKIQEKLSDNDIQAVRDAFREFDPGVEKISAIPPRFWSAIQMERKHDASPVIEAMPESSHE